MEERLKVLVIGRQAGIQQQVREILDSMGKDVEVLYVDGNTPRSRLLGEAMEPIKDLDYPDMSDPRIAALVEHVKQGLKDVRPQAQHWMISDRLPMDSHVAMLIPSWDANWPQLQSISGNEKPLSLEDLMPFYKTRMAGKEESMNGKLLEAISKTAQSRVDIPTSKPNWRKNRMGFLDGLNKRKF